jgi:hypothetical protein
MNFAGYVSFVTSIHTINIYCSLYGHLTSIYRYHTNTHSFPPNNLSDTNLTDPIKHFYRILKSWGHRYTHTNTSKIRQLVFSKLIVQWVTLSYLVVPLFFTKITCLDVSGLKSYLSCCYKQRRRIFCVLYAQFCLHKINNKMYYFMS